MQTQPLAYVSVDVNKIVKALNGRSALFLKGLASTPKDFETGGVLSEILQKKFITT